jgi:ABC-type lipoprotein export system ATPase subunit
VTSAVETHNLFRLHQTEEGSGVALQGLTLSVAERELVVVFGPSGSGKTTLLRILAGLDRPSAGTVTVFGTDLRKLRGRALREYRSRTLGYADQHYTRALAPELTARELVGLQLGLLGVEPRIRRRRADELLERVGLAHRAQARPRELSGGEQQRVALCAALAHRPRLFIADEPTGELDAANAARIYGLIGELTREAGATTVIVSHDAASATIADRVVQVRDGRVSAEAAPARGPAEEIVVARGGWIRLPEELLRRTGIDERASATLRPDGILVSAIGTARPADVPRRIERRAPGPPVAELRAVGKRYADAPVLDGLTATFRAGELAVVRGPSGSGKTTLLHLLAGVEAATSGEVEVLGTPLSSLDAAGRARLRRTQIAVVAQGTDLVPFLTALENVELALALRGVEGVEATERAVAALGSVGLDELAGQRVARLSTGERQRVALARAVAARPALLLADEPTARLDEENSRAVGALLARLAAESGTAVVCATHDPALIEQADREVSLEPAPPASAGEAALVTKL